MRVACVNQDRGISPGRHKGAAVHLDAVRRALAAHDADIVSIDRPTHQGVRQALLEASHIRPIELIYERFALGATAASEFASERGIPLVLEINAPLSAEAAQWRGGPVDGARDDEAFVVRRADRIIAVSSAVAEYAVELGARPERVDVMPNGVDIDQFRPRAPNDAVRNELVPAGRFAVGFHGRLRPWHGFPRLVESLQRLLGRGLPLHLVVVGAGDFDDAIAGRIASDRVTRVPWVAHQFIGDCVAAFDVLPLSYAPDAPCYFSPLKLTEAMACEVVPVVPDLGDLTEIVHHEQNGLVYSARRPEGLDDAIARLVADADERSKLGRAARCAAAHFSWDRIAAAILETPRRPGAETAS